MKRLASALLCLALTSTGTHAADGDANHSRWKGVIACVDRSFYDGGYDEGDAKRIALMNAFLSLQNLPAYDETGLKREMTDRDAYMAGYESCEARWTELQALAKKHGIVVRED